MEKPSIIKGNVFKDNRGFVSFNNSFDLTQVKRMYCIENSLVQKTRGWKGHKIEHRWFIASEGEFLIEVVDLNYFKNHKTASIFKFNINFKTFDVLQVPPGFATRITSLINNSKLFCFSNFLINDSENEVRFDLNR